MKNKINMLSFEDYSLSLSYNEERGYYEYVGCNNRSIVRKGSFVHLMSSMGKRDFAVLDAYSCGLSKEENVRSNRGMREVLQTSSLMAYCLVSRRQEPWYGTILWKGPMQCHRMNLRGAWRIA